MCRLDMRHQSAHFWSILLWFPGPPRHSSCLSQQGYYPVTKRLDSEHHVGPSLGIGYPSLCIIPDDVQQTSDHSYAGGFIGLPTQLIVAGACSCKRHIFRCLIRAKGCEGHMSPWLIKVFSHWFISGSICWSWVPSRWSWVPSRGLRVPILGSWVVGY